MSGSTIGGVVGGVIGFYVGGPTGAQIGFALGSYVGSSFDTYHTDGPRLGDLPVQTSQEGAPRPIVYGTPQPFMCNIMQAGPKNRFLVNEKQDNGKGGPTYTTDHEEVTQTFALRVCEGNENIKLLRLWADGKLFYDAFGGPLEADSVTAQTKFTFHPGGEDEEPDPSLESLPVENGGGVGNVLAYRGTAYIVFDNFNLTAYGGRIPQIQVQVSTNATISQMCSEGLVAWWPLDDASATGVAREVVQGLDGEYHNIRGPSTIEARGSLNHTGTASAFFGPDDGMIVRDASALSLVTTDSWSACVWYSIDATHSNENQILGIAYVDTFSGRHIWGNHLGNYSSSGHYLTPAGGYNNGSDHYGISDSDIGIGGAHYQVTTYDGTTLRLYIDGFLRDELVTGGPEGVANYIMIGGADNGLVGTVQDLQFWGRALSATEIQNNYLTGPAIFEIPDAPGTFMRPNGTVIAPCSSTATVDTVPLSDIVLDLGRRCDVEATQLDVAADETVEVDGFLIGRPTTGQAALQTLSNAYFRHYPEYDLKVHSVPCGQSVVLSLTDDDFVESEEDERTVRQSIELPRKWLLNYSDKDYNYVVRVQQAERESQNIASTGNQTIEFPLVFDANQAAQKVEIVAKVMTEAALGGTLKRKLPAYKYAQLVASDRIAYDDKEWLIVKLDWVDGVIEFEAIRDRSSNYESAAVGGVALDPTAPVSSVKGPSVLQALNLPRLTTAENKPGMYMGVTGFTSAWPGADIYVKWPGSSQEVFLRTVTMRATMGYLTSDIAASADPISAYVFNERSLASFDSDQIASGLGAMAITTNGTSEIKQYQTAAETATADEWSLSDISHGRLGTTNASHLAEDEFLMLDQNIWFQPIDASYAGLEITFRAVTRGTPRENNDPITVTFMPAFTGPETVAYLETLDGEYVETIDGLRVEFISA